MKTHLATLCLLLCAMTAPAQAPRLAAVRADALTIHLWGHDLVPGECYAIEVCSDLSAGIWEPYDDFVAFTSSGYLGSINLLGMPAAFFRLVPCNPLLGLAQPPARRPVLLHVVSPKHGERDQ